MVDLPEAVRDATYTNPKTNSESTNVLYSYGNADGHATTRSVKADLFEQPEFGRFTKIAEQVSE
jgi:hypothetical protein